MTRNSFVDAGDVLYDRDGIDLGADERHLRFYAAVTVASLTMDARALLCGKVLRCLRGSRGLGW